MKTNQTREEFEQSATLTLKSVIAEARRMRNKVNRVEEDIMDKEARIQNYQNMLLEIEKELVKIQTKLYASGTT